MSKAGWSASRNICNTCILSHIPNRSLLCFPPRSTTAQFNLGKLLLRRRRTEPPRAGSIAVNQRGEVAGDDVREAKDMLQKVIRDNEEHSGARFCLAQALAEEGGVELLLWCRCAIFFRGSAALTLLPDINFYLNTKYI